jgi:para-aminobenzoate synthetase component 1
VISRNEAVTILNTWGSHRIPFLFIIDFEMKAIRLFRLDKPLDRNIKYCFSGTCIPSNKINFISDLEFKKYPVSFIEYEKSFIKIKKHLQAGNTFLINLTFPTPVDTNLCLNEIYECSKAKYKLLVNEEFVCFSPETFIKISNGVISAYPMKGTINASIPDAEQIIMNSPKETAEHHTIVDLLRNDLSMVASEVVVTRFRYLERIKTHEGVILQVSSEISGKLPQDYYNHLGDILFALLPAGSVTGAPKTKTLEIIREVEKHERGYYAGVCGIFDGVNIDSAVMIRFIEIFEGRMRFRSGGGITFLSDCIDEYNELIDKVYVPVI